MLCKRNAKPRLGVRDLKQNKHQLLHRLANIWTTLIYNTITLEIQTCKKLQQSLLDYGPHKNAIKYNLATHTEIKKNTFV